jgi:hypothetical protein
MDKDYKDKQFSIDVSLLESDSDLDVHLVTVDGAARDSGNGTATTLRAGLALGKVTSSGNYKEYDGAAGDGSEKDSNVVILAEETDVSGGDVTDVPVIYKGNVDNSKVIVDNGTLGRSNVQRLDIDE